MFPDTKMSWISPNLKLAAIETRDLSLVTQLQFPRFQRSVMLGVIAGGYSDGIPFLVWRMLEVQYASFIKPGQKHSKTNHDHWIIFYMDHLPHGCYSWPQGNQENCSSLNDGITVGLWFGWLTEARFFHGTLYAKETFEKRCDILGSSLKTCPFEQKMLANLDTFGSGPCLTY